MNLTRQEIDSLCHLAREAGSAIMDIYRQDFSAWQKDNGSPLTEADLQADRIIRSGLEALFPNVFILSEESISIGSVDREGDELFFLVDPLDGTKEFLKRNDEFTVNIALICCGKPIFGVVFAPALDELFWAAQGLGAWKMIGKNVQEIGLRVAETKVPLRVIGSRSHGSNGLNEWLAKLEGEYLFIGAGSSLKFCRIAEGSADIYPRLGPTSQWDTAAAQCVLVEAGGFVVDRGGHPLVYGFNKPVLNPEFFATSAGAMSLVY